MTAVKHSESLLRKIKTQRGRYETGRVDEPRERCSARTAPYTLALNLLKYNAITLLAEIKINRSLQFLFVERSPNVHLAKKFETSDKCQKRAFKT